MDIKILIALITSITAVVTAIVSAYISLKNSKQSKNIEFTKLKIQTLMNKKAELEKAKTEITEQLEDAQDNSINVENIATLVMKEFKESKKILSKYGHNFQQNRFNRLNSKYRKLEDDYVNALAENHNKKGKVSEETVSKITKNVSQMGKMKSLIEDAISEELREISFKLNDLMN